MLIKRAGDVIPYVIGPVVEARTGDEKVFTPPQTCPACGEPVENIPGEVAWYCINAACPAQLVRNLEHFVSRPAMDISGLGIRIVEQLVDSGMVQDVADLYTLRQEGLLKNPKTGEGICPARFQKPNRNTSKWHFMNKVWNSYPVPIIIELGRCIFAHQKLLKSYKGEVNIFFK